MSDSTPSDPADETSGNTPDETLDGTANTNCNLLLAAAFLTALICIVEIIGGVFSRSITLLADAGFMFADFLGLIVTWKAFQIRQIEGDRIADAFTWNYSKKIHLLLLLFSALIAAYAIFRIVATDTMIATSIMLWVGVIGLIANIVCWLIVSRVKTDDDNVAGAKDHLMNDVVGSIAVIAAALAILWGTTGIPSQASLMIDPLLAIGFAVLMLYNAIDVLRDNREAVDVPQNDEEN